MKDFSIKIQVFLQCVLFLGLFLVCTAGQEDEMPPLAPMEKTELEALYYAIQGFVGKWWNGSDLYPDPCGWTPIQGVSCDLFDKYWYITTINIGPILDNSLLCTNNAKFTHHLFQLKHLKSLSFFHCFLSSSQNPTKIPVSDWESLSNSLESLQFRCNPGLIGTIPSAIGYLKHLESLVLLENGLVGTLPMELGNLVNLRRLVLAGNQFTGQIPMSIGVLSKLLILDSSRNRLSGPLPSTFGGLTSLLKLDLSSNKLQGKLPKEIGNLKNLTLLDLSGNNISGELIRSLEDMVSLEVLVLSNNPFGGNLMGIQWKNLQNLEILDLSNTGLIGAIPDTVAESRRLRFLALNNNNLSGIPSPKLETIPDIGALYLNDNNFSGRLEFSERFYRRMGRRFGAWNNRNLCYMVESVSNNDAPYGVKQCRQENSTISLHSESDFEISTDRGSLNQNSQIGVSLGYSSCVVDVLWWVRGMVSFLLWRLFL